MSTALILPFVLSVGLLVAVVAALLTRRRTSTVGINEHVDLLSYARRARTWRLASLALAVVACLAIPTLGVGGTDAAPAVVPALAGTLVIAVIGVGEATFRRPMTITRSAVLRPRRVGDLVPWGWLTSAAAALAGLAATLGIGTLYGSPDDLGRAGRAISVVCDGATLTRTPWPGSHYGMPIAFATIVSVVLAVIACGVIARRPSPAAESTEVDTALRRWSIAGVLQTLTLVACVTLVPVLLLMTLGARASDCAPGGYGLLAQLSLLGAVAAGILGIAACAGLCTGPGVKVDDIPPPSRGDATAVGVPL
jgi:hypothetical protein